MKGQASLEALASLLFLTSALTAGFIASYIAFAHAWMAYSVHKGVLCLAEDQSTYHCQSIMIDQTKKTLPFGSVTKAHLEKRIGSYFGEIFFILPGNETWKIKESYELKFVQIQKASRWLRL
jgi:hypothetical protein